MRCSRGAGAPVPRRAGFFLQIINVIGVGLLVSACASSHASYEGYSNVGGPQPSNVAMSVPKKVELEADGLAVQAPPLKRKDAEPDDPSEPFSPNYGPAPAGEPDAAEPGRALREMVPASHPRPLPFRSRTRPMTMAEAEAIKVRAMVAHELRNP